MDKGKHCKTCTLFYCLVDILFNCTDFLFKILVEFVCSCNLAPKQLMFECILIEIKSDSLNRSHFDAF